MRSTLRVFAKVAPSTRMHAASTPSSKASRLSKKPMLSLDQFLQRQRVLGLWRTIMRAVYRIPKSSTRDEMRNHVRHEFSRNKHVSDPEHVKYLLSAGKAEFETMRRYIDEQAAAR